MLIDDRSVQRALAAAHLYSGAIDGDFGDGSRTAARAMAAKRAPRYAPTWPDARVRLAVEQAMMTDVGTYHAAIDGIGGPATQAALIGWQDWITFKRPPLPDAVLTHQPTVFPRQSGVAAFFGKPADETNLVSFVPAYPLLFAGKAVSKVRLNKRCAESGARILEDVLAEYGLDRIAELQLNDFGGSFSPRPMRNGKTWSMHAYGAAWDFDADRNQLNWTSATAYMAKPDYRAFIEAHYRHGWISLGRERNFDWMHFQAVRL